MADIPWLTIIGLGEDGLNGLTPASHAALNSAEIIMGPPRHLSLLPGDVPGERIEWPVPFADGIPHLLALKGRNVVVLASGDPFWFGAGSVLARHLAPGDWRAFPGPSTFALAASRLGWPLEQTACLGLHAAPFGRLRPHLAPGQQAIVTLRDGAAARDLAAWLADLGFGDSDLTVMEALGGPREQLRSARASDMDWDGIAHPVCIALTCKGDGRPLPQATGLGNGFFDHDGQITKRPVRALTLSALAPVPGEHLWDIGGGSGSIAIEWLLCHPSLRATTFEPDPDRAARITGNAAALGADRLTVVTGAAPHALSGQDVPDAVFIGGGLSEEMLDWIWGNLPRGTRLVANAVTLEAEALLAQWQADKGGELMRIELARARPLGGKRGWKSAYPIVQWGVTL